MIEKNFDKWNNLKKDLHFNEKRKYFKEADIWFVYMGQNIGYEVFGKGERYLRPVIVFRRSGKDTFLGIPLTSKIKEDKFHTIVKFKDKINSAILNQVKTFDSKRLMYQIGKLSVDEFEKIENKFVEFYNITPSKKKGDILTKCEQRKDDKIVAQKNKNVKVSIITVVYNNKDTIKDAIESVLSQTYTNMEYIIVDGASTDGTVEIVKSYGDKISKFVSEKDKGIYDGLNKGVGLATGDIVCFLHSDDLYNNKDTIEKIMKLFDADNSLDGIYGDLVYTPKEDTSKVFRYWKSKDFDISLLKKGWMPAHPTLFLKREVYEKYGKFDLSFKIAADYDFMLRVLSSGTKVKYLPEVLYKMRVGGESNKSIKNIMLKSKEDLKALKKNNIGGVYTLIVKNLSKIIQFVKK